MNADNKTQSEVPQFKPFGPTGPLTEEDCQIIVLALGCLMGSFGLDENRKLTDSAKRALEASRKFGVTL